MPPQPTISVIIPVYNGARFIRDALQSVCTQTHLPAEVVVVDDASTDNTCDVVKAFAGTTNVPIKLLNMEKNTGGPYGPASIAFHRTSGNYVCILDADDMFAPDAFETYMAMFAEESSADVGLATSDFMTFDDESRAAVTPSFFATQARVLGRVVEDASATGVVLDPGEARRLLSMAFVIPFKGMVSRPAWERLGGPNLEYGHVCDCEFVWRLVATTRFRVRMLNRPLMRVRVWSGSMSSNHINESTELIRLYREMLGGTTDALMRTHIRQRLERELFDLSYELYKRKLFRLLAPAVCGLAAARFRRLVARTLR
jgi:glycosyltransferase involved in cell wall biosynthesis